MKHPHRPLAYLDTSILFALGAAALLMAALTQLGAVTPVHPDEDDAVATAHDETGP